MPEHKYRTMMIECYSNGVGIVLHDGKYPPFAREVVIGWGDEMLDAVRRNMEHLVVREGERPNISCASNCNTDKMILVMDRINKHILKVIL